MLKDNVTKKADVSRFGAMTCSLCLNIQKNMPKRIQFQRKKGFKLPENCVRVTRPSQFGNPFRLGSWIDYINDDGLIESVQITVGDALDLYENYLLEKLEENPDFLAPLKGKDLDCFCRLDARCHGDILLDYANR
jgi:hypothetical protein